MNAHTPFDANQDWTNPYCQNSSNDQMVDALLGNAYHVVRTVYCNLGNLKLLYDFLNQYGMVIGVNSEEELKALSTQVKYSRIYGFSRAGDRQVTDYLYVEGDRTGITPDDPEATGSWITVATSGSNGGGTSSSEGAYIPWVYSNGSATGGETTINVPDGTVGVPFIIVNGDMQYVGRGFEFNVDSLSVTLAQPLEEGDEVVFLLTGVPAVPDNPNINDWIQINWLYNNGAAVGGEQVIAIPYTFQSIPAVYKNGLRLYKGLTTESYTADPDNQRIFLTEPLTTNDRLIVQIGGEARVLEATDRTLQEVARAANVKDSEVILSTNTVQSLNNKKVIYNPDNQQIYVIPELPTNVYISSVVGNILTYTPGNIQVELLTKKETDQNTLWRNQGDVRGWGVKGDAVHDDTAALTNVLNDTPVGQKINGNGKTYKVTSLPDISRFVNTRFVYERIPGQPLYYASEEFVQGELFKITDTPYYNAWPQDKAFVYDDVIYCPFMASDRHGVSRLHVSWVRSGDDGQTWTTPEWLTDLHPDYPTVNYHCMSMGVVRNRLFAMIETRTLASNALVTCEIWDRPMSRNYHPTGGITKAANQSVAVITIPDHGLFAGDFVNFSNSGIIGVSGNMTVTSVIDRNTFTVTTPNKQAFDQNNSTSLWHMGTSFHQSPWRKTNLGLIPMVTEVHSFTAINNDSFMMGYHQGDVAPREVGMLYFPDAFNNPGNYIKRRIPAEYEADAAEPCVKYFDGVLYVVTRGTRSDRLGSSLHRSNDLGITWQSLRFPNNVHHSTLPFAKVGNELILFGTERADNEWEANAPDQRYFSSYPRTFYTRVNLDTWNLDNTQWVNITDQIYQGGIVNSGVGVGSVVVKDSYIYYLFGGEDHLNPWTYGDNSAKDPFKSDGHPSDLYCYKMKIGPDNRVSRDFRYGAVPDRAVPVFFGTNGIRTVPAPMEFTGDLGLGHVTIRASTSNNVRSEVLMEGEYGFIGKSVPTNNPAGQRTIFCGGDSTSSSSGAQITLYGASNTASRRIVYNGAEHLFQTADVKPYNDNAIALGGPSNRFTTAYLGSNPIVTSNGEKKTEPVVFDDAFLDAWGDVRYIMYQWLDAVQLKGNDARIHFGVIAQQIRDVFIAHGLMDENSTDCRYAVLCYDKYPRMTDMVFSHNEIVEHTDDEGNVTTTEEPVYTEVVIHEEGEEWGVRPDGIFFAEAAYQRRKLERIEARLSALEQK